MPFQLVDDEHMVPGDDSKDGENLNFAQDDVLQSQTAQQKDPCSFPSGT